MDLENLYVFYSRLRKIIKTQPQHESLHWPSDPKKIEALSQLIFETLPFPFLCLCSGLTEDPKKNKKVTNGQAPTPILGIKLSQKIIWVPEMANPLNDFIFSLDATQNSSTTANQANAPTPKNTEDRPLSLDPLQTQKLIPLLQLLQPSVCQISVFSFRKSFLLVGTSTSLTPTELLSIQLVIDPLREYYQRAELEDQLHFRSQLLSIASHELKTPLTSIYGILQLQERILRSQAQAPYPPEQTAPLSGSQPRVDWLSLVIRQVERMNELIDGLLDVSRIQNGRLMIEPAEVDISQILSECIQGRLNPIATEAGVRLQIDCEPKIIAWADPVRIEEVITNLVMNAIRFSPEGGVVWIRLYSDGPILRLSVRDQGPQLSLTDREKIFEPFQQIQTTARRESPPQQPPLAQPRNRLPVRLGGLGLGLYISRHIAQLHGGTVSLTESLAGKGNTFEAQFPRHPIRLLTNS